MVEPSVAEAFLRNNPGIASVFHPEAKAKSPAGAKPSTLKAEANVRPLQTSEVTPQAPTCDAGDHTVPGPVAAEQAPDTQTAEHREHLGDLPIPASLKPPPGGGKDRSANRQAVSAGPLESGCRREGGKRKRRRRRRGHPVITQEWRGTTGPFLKALEGTSPQERLRIMACLNELAGMVASA